MTVFIFINIYLTPVLGIVFCISLVEILKKVKKDQPTGMYTFLLTISFVLIVWSIAVTASIGV
ncbi:hypothetical protein LLY41_11215 [Cytobacillus firmus]|uniref:hypothetical protein n=1 Tax=Cytobacillus firmus TaxID=1399 RepID=UPI0021851C61|nr:hypothetical protein [Cytobacillus firmus]URM31017.1 hypothetical protein LLY41_11215 [Cytobacillus firmus]